MEKWNFGAGLLLVFAVLLVWANLLALDRPGRALPDFPFLVNFAYGVVLLALVCFSGKQKPGDPGNLLRDACLGLAHAHVLVGCVHAAKFLSLQNSSLVVSLLWGAYAIAILSWAWRARDLKLARSSLLILLISSLKVWLVDLDRSDRLASVLTLVALGAVLYTCGILYRRTREWA